MTFQVVEVSDGEGRRAFFELAREIYRDDPLWVPAADAAFFLLATRAGAGEWRQLLALSNQRVGARILISWRKGEKTGAFSLFECDRATPEAGMAVLRAGEEILRAVGVDCIVGPQIGNVVQGLQSGGFEQPQVILTPRNPPWYADLFFRAGYHVRQKMETWHFQRDRLRLPSRGKIPFRFRLLSSEPLRDELDKWAGLQTEIFANRAGYRVRSADENRNVLEAIGSQVKDLLLLGAETLAGEPAGALIALPDWWQKRPEKTPPDRARIMSIGVHPRYLSSHLGRHLAAALQQILLERGFQSAEASWIRRHNFRAKYLARFFLAQPGRSFILMEKTLFS